MPRLMIFKKGGGAYCLGFDCGWEIVELPDGKYTFRNENGETMPMSFEDVNGFKFDNATVKLEDGWTFIHKDGTLWEDRFVRAESFKEGLGKAYITDSEFVYYDREGRKLTNEQAEFLLLIYRQPTSFLSLQTKDFKNEWFIEDALVQAKDGLARIIYSENDINDDYVKYCLDLLNACKEMVKRENEKVKAEEISSQKRKSKSIDTIQDEESYKLPKSNRFKFGNAVVKLEDGWTYIHDDGTLWEDTFVSVEDFKDGVGKVYISDKSYIYDDECVYYDREERRLTDDQAKSLQLIYRHPISFLNLTTENFKDEVFIEDALMLVKDRLYEVTENKEDVDDYAKKYCFDLLNACKEKVERENKKIEAEEISSQIKKSNLEDTIKDFKF